jgi:glucuronoarabinoxylan endo-1,4-beta-xylanase
MLFGSLCYGQRVERSVIANGGGFFKTATMSLSYTIGESGVGLGRASSLALLQGYNQPDNLGGIGIAPLSQTSLQVYPNPARETLFIEMTGASISELSILNPQGQIVSRQSSVLAGQQMDISFLPAGVYIISCSSDRRLTSVRFVKY